MNKSIEHIVVEYNGQDTSDFLEAIGELREKYGEDCMLRLEIDVYKDE